MSASTGDRPRLHPVIWVAAASVTVASLVAVGAMTGLLPASKASVDPAANPPVATTASPAATPAPAPAVAAASTPADEGTTKATTHHAKRRPAPEPERLAAAYPPPPPVAQAAPPAPPPARVCPDCGIVESVRVVKQEGQGSGLGAVAGGVLGGALGNGVGQGNGRTLATLAGIVGGAFAGNKIEKSTKQTSHYEITVRLQDGSSRMFSQESEPPWREGDHVRVNGNSLGYDG